MKKAKKRGRNRWKAAFAAILLVLAAVWAIRIYQWRLWVIARADKADAVHAYLVEPITMPDGKQFTRAQLLDALLRQAVAGAQPAPAKK